MNIYSRLKASMENRDMTRGNPLAAMMKFSLPLLIGNLAQLLYNTINAMILGQMIDSRAFSAVGVSLPIQNLFFVFFMTVGSGVSIVVAQYFGAKDKEKLSRSIGSALIMTLVATLTITAVGIPLSGTILKATNVNMEIFSWSRQYLMIMFAGAMGVGFYNVLSGILRGMGDSIFPLFVLIGTSLVNIGLVFLFVGVFKFNVAGAAFATVIAQTLSALICLRRLVRLRGTVEISRRTLRPKKLYVLQILRIGLPTGIQQTVLTMSSVLVQTLINGIVVFNAAGIASTTIFVAAATAFNQIDALALLPSQALSIGGSTFAGMNIGAGRFDRVKSGFRIMCVMTMATSIILFTLIRVFSEDLIRLFIKSTEADADEIVKWGVFILNIMTWDYILMAVMQPSSGILRGAGDTLPPMIIAIVCTVFMRIPMAYLWARAGTSEAFPGGNPNGIYWSYVICFSCAAFSTVAYYLTGRWKKKALIKAGDSSVITN